MLIYANVLHWYRMTKPVRSPVAGPSHRRDSMDNIDDSPVDQAALADSTTTASAPPPQFANRYEMQRKGVVGSLLSRLVNSGNVDDVSSAPDAKRARYVFCSCASLVYTCVL